MKRISLSFFLFTSFFCTLNAVAADIEQSAVDPEIEKKVDEIFDLSGLKQTPELRQVLAYTFESHPPMFEFFKAQSKNPHSDLFKLTDQQVSVMLTETKRFRKEKQAKGALREKVEKKVDELFALNGRNKTPERKKQIIEWAEAGVKPGSETEDSELESRFKFLKNVWHNPNFYMFTTNEKAQEVLKRDPTKLVFYLSSRLEGSFSMLAVKNKRKNPSRTVFRFQDDAIYVDNNDDLDLVIKFGESPEDAFDRLVVYIQNNEEYNGKLRTPEQLPELLPVVAPPLSGETQDQSEPEPDLTAGSAEILEKAKESTPILSSLQKPDSRDCGCSLM